MKRQQAFIASMINKVISADTLTKPDRVYSFLKAATGSVVTDPDLASLSKLANLAYQFRKTDLDNITFITVPIEEYAPDPNRLLWSDSAAGLWKVLLNDEPLPKRYKRGRHLGRPGARRRLGLRVRFRVRLGVRYGVRLPCLAVGGHHGRRRRRGEQEEQEADANGLCA